MTAIKTNSPQTLSITGRSHGKLRLWLIVAASLIALRVALPYVLLHLANQRLASMPGYHGHINDLDLALYRGAYRIEQFQLDKVDSLTQERTKFLGAAVIDLSIAWRALFKGGLVGELDIEQPLLRFTLNKTEPADLQKDTTSLGDLLKDFMPLRINRLALHNGSLEYADEGSAPPLNLALTDLEALARNLTSVADKDELLPATVEATATLYGGALLFHMSLDPLSQRTIFDMDLSLEGMQLPLVNDLFEAYANFDVNQGTLSLYTEIATRDGAFKGYVKPIIKDLDVLGHEDRNDNLLRKLWEGTVGAAGTILTNPRKEQLATKVVLEGRFDDPDVRAWSAVIEILRNAFIRALEPAIDREITIASPLEDAGSEKSGFLQDVFGSKKKSTP
jgi:hypothetical protein